MPGRPLLWRVAAVHPAFGAGPFSPTVQLAVDADAAGRLTGRAVELASVRAAAGAAGAARAAGAAGAGGEPNHALLPTRP
eukprot:2452779-Prymnesium_polylepis.1